MEKQIIESVLKSLLKRGLITSSEKERIIKKVSEKSGFCLDFYR